MSFNSIEFLIFLPIVIVLYWLVPKKVRWVLLLLASYFFYMYWNPMLIVLILFTTLVSYSSGILMDKYKDNKKLKLTLMITTLVVCLGTLFFFKYFNFVAESVTNLINVFSKGDAKGVTLSLILPVGISFYTFQTLSYVIDVYKGKISSEKHLGYYALFVVYFPQLVAGPIERPDVLLPQLKEEHKINSSDLSLGIRIMLVGFIKKVVIADGVALFVESVYGNLPGAFGEGVLIATLLFAIQIYCDFSGYTDIAIGVARLMGIKLSKNFDQPYSSTSVREFWRRWHISLSNWFRDYVYIPLGGSRVKYLKWCFNVLVVFLLSGLWHGANWTFVIWGLLHGLYQIVEKGIDVVKERRGIEKKVNTFTIIRNRIITILLVCFAWIFFRANNVNDAFLAIQKLFTGWSNNPIGYLASLDLSMLKVIEVMLFIVFLIYAPKIIYFEEEDKLSGGYINRRIFIAFALILIMSALVLLKASGVESSFIYFQF